MDFLFLLCWIKISHRVINPENFVKCPLVRSFRSGRSGPCKRDPDTTRARSVCFIKKENPNLKKQNSWRMYSYEYLQKFYWGHMLLRFGTFLDLDFSFWIDHMDRAQSTVWNIHEENSPLSFCFQIAFGHRAGPHEIVSPSLNVRIPMFCLNHENITENPCVQIRAKPQKRTRIRNLPFLMHP